jgi:phosphatidylserine/phosphatidylglycerophosphate/cardiolipin synthase-like enzyme
VTLDATAIARRWADELPREFVRQLIAALGAGPAALQALRSSAALPASAAALRTAMHLAERGEGPYAAGVLAGRLDTLEEQPQITAVWTGPESDSESGRLTLAVVADLIDEARAEILLVSYATVPGENVRQALHAAANRGVAITMLLERSIDNPGFTGHGNPLPGLPARRLAWPATARPAGAAMHGKVLIVDRRTALVGSANLTGHALERNLECGLLLRRGNVPALLAAHLLGLRGLVEV